jgi:RNA polymerase sigma factor (sigma-70 family)
MPAQEHTDSELVSRCLAGDRDAFSRIVARYQILICSLAYSRLGNLGQSEDVAQETFITAWKHLGLLREPDKLRSWLCGIVRNRLHKHVAREMRELASNSASLETVHESPAGEALPSEQTIGREEEAILWRSLEKIPELYREPLILFYREHQSVGQVAAELELTEDAVKQRLSRGRKLLQEEVQAFVENTLLRTAPGQTFSGAVLAALPLAQAATIGAGAIGKGTAAAKSGILGAWLVPLMPFLGMLAGIASQWMIIRATAVSARDRQKRQIHLIIAFVILIGTSWGREVAVRFLEAHFAWSDRSCFVAMAIFWWLYCVGLATWIIPGFRRIHATRQQSPEAMEAFRLAMLQIKPVTAAFMSAGWHLMLFTGPLFIAWRVGDFAAAGIIAALMVALGVWNFCNRRNQSEIGGLGHLGVCCAVILAVVNLRLDVWLASARGVSLAEIHVLYPPWIVPALTLILMAWIGIVWTATKPAPPVTGGGPSRRPGAFS